MLKDPFILTSGLLVVGLNCRFHASDDLRHVDTNSIDEYASKTEYMTNLISATSANPGILTNWISR
jgi:hypothetical protein